MALQFPKYPFSSILGWSISRYETFDKCKRQYFYQYYSRFVPGISQYTMTRLKDLTSIPLETGNVVHDCMEAFLKRLQASDSDIDNEKYFKYANDKLSEYFSKKSFIETYYGQSPIGEDDIAVAQEKIRACLDNFLNSPCCSWLYMKAMTNRTGWMIEPGGYGETRLDGMKAYCKMDFLFPVDGDVYILDWKTGAKDPVKHAAQLMGYAVAANSNFSIPWNKIFPKIVYLYPQYDELEIVFKEDDLSGFFETIRKQTEEMYLYCRNKDLNIPKEIAEFPKSQSAGICKYCKFQELCAS